MEYERNMITGTLMPIHKSRKLKDIDVSEISFVNEPATRRKFLFAKSADGTSVDSLEQKLEESGLNEDEQTEFLKMLSRISGSGELIDNLAETKIQKSADLWPSLSGAAFEALCFAKGISSDDLEDEDD